MSEDTLQLFKETGAYLTGHFELTSGRHSGAYFQCALLLQHPALSEKLCKMLADRFRGKGATVVIGPAVGGIIVSFEVARQLGARSLYTERENGVLRLRRNFEIRKGEKVLVVEDVVTTGGSTQEVISLARSEEGEVIGVGALVDRSGGEARYDVPFEPLLRLQVESFSKGECPLCREKIPLTKPGSRGLSR
ncbi:MAG: orotate phosphoribosyltransferase [Candidatus Omnitrophica bacterium]|nr:orotate phosphoribosyltransferase [Candidatus Omnitrophota bacterium]